MTDAFIELLDPRIEYGEEIDALSQDLGITAVTASLLWNRGMRTSEECSRFLKKEVEIFHDAYLLADMEKAVDRILKAKEDREKVVIYGDYDVDGVTATSTLCMYLRDKGIDVSYYIPNREGEGYGINLSALDSLISEGNRLMITVDTGITAADEVEYARKNGLDVIITDHHECGLSDDGQMLLPDACAVINPRRSDCVYPFKELAGVGVVFKLLCAIEQKLNDLAGLRENYIRNVIMRYGDLIAIGTVADVMPLIDENRLIVSVGMALTDKNPRPGVAALLDIAQGGPDKNKTKKTRRRRKMTSSTIGYTIAPRINAAGRIASAKRAVELFLTDEEFEAQAIASELCEINRQRQLLENKIAEQVQQIIEAEFDFERDLVIVLEDDSWHQGVIGIVASRITERYNLPAILISFDGEIGKGSGRGIKGLNLVDALNSCSDCLIRFGGHELAAGLSIERGRIAEFKQRINDYARANLNLSDLTTRTTVDCELRAEDLNLSQANELYLLEPYGVANPTPVFVVRDAAIIEKTPIGSNRHTRLTVEKDGVRFVAVYFGIAAEELDFFTGDHADIIFNLDVNDFMNIQSVQLIVRQMYPCRKYLSELDRQREIYKTILDNPRSEYLRGIDINSFIPLREDFVAVYVYIRREFRFGRNRLSIRSIERNIGAPCYTKVRFIIDILSETGVIAASPVETSEPEGGSEYFDFTINNVSTKISLERSDIYKKLLELR
ncbi:MAG: single-stranded-DNA-specific exonuclease RecJ [Clostridiales bacterium]|nr:single-stranded-DNA-specific exonuclease RecJ [Clostridiales bacterium]